MVSDLLHKAPNMATSAPISPEEQEELREAFDKIGYRVREIVQELMKTSEQLTFDQFTEIVHDLKSTEVAKTFRKAINKKEGICAIAGTSEQSGTQHSYSGQRSHRHTHQYFSNFRVHLDSA
ncbi:hypothetical protein CRUP_012557 [Coryphaenoides rupestris]|nr:hypothetical protein CRUP_012557 [Coryphaenoides rupestris]